MSAASSPLHPMPSAPAQPDAAQLHNIWLAGLGAMARAQAEGSKAFDALVKQGLEWQSQAREQIAEAAQRAGALAASAHPAGGGRWNALEGIFEQRVARALANLGLPSAQELAQLRARVQALENNLPAPARRTAAKKPAAKTQRAKSARK
ncbi:MAG: phasin family protein [Burkholderiaceae bacterium]|nr:phasin family protein [Burkholderiaceae bacterium]